MRNIRKDKWRITKINDGLEMTRIEGQEIACRKLNWFEKIIYWQNIRRKYASIIHRCL